MPDIDESLLSDVADVAQAQERVEVPEKTETKTETKTAEEDDFVGDDQDFSHQPWDERETETEEEAESEEAPSKTETETEPVEPVAEPEKETEPAAQEDNNAWVQTLPPAPMEFGLPEPEFDEEGNVTNMTGQEFLNYTIQKASHQAQVTNWNSTVMNRALDEAEKILPEIKTNPTVRQLVQNQVVANTINGQSYTAVDAARDVKALIGEAKSTGAQNQRTSIRIQKNSAVESPTNQKKTAPSKIDKLAKRLKANDPAAFEDVFSLWQEEGKV